MEKEKSMPILDKEGTEFNPEEHKIDYENSAEHYVRLNGPASKRMLKALEAMAFLVEVNEAAPNSIPNSVLIEKFQDMIDSHAVDLMFGAVAFVTSMTERGFLKKAFDSRFMEAGRVKK